jgi:hypothetical protein
MWHVAGRSCFLLPSFFLCACACARRPRGAERHAELRAGVWGGGWWGSLGFWYAVYSLLVAGHWASCANRQSTAACGPRPAAAASGCGYTKSRRGQPVFFALLGSAPQELNAIRPEARLFQTGRSVGNSTHEIQTNFLFRSCCRAIGA